MWPNVVITGTDPLDQIRVLRVMLFAVWHGLLRITGEFATSEDVVLVGLPHKERVTRLAGRAG